MKKKQVMTSFSNLTGVVIVLAIVIVLNVVLGAVSIRKDMTEERIYTLANGTKELLDTMSRDVTLKLFYTKSNENLPIAFKQYAQRVGDLLREYVTHGGGNLVLETYDPKPDSDEEEWAQRYGLAGQSLGTLGMQPDLYFGLVAVSGAREAVLPFLTPDAEPQLEYLVTRLIHEVTRSHKPKLGVMSSLPVLPPSRPLPGMPPGAGGEGWKVMEEMGKQYELQAVDATAESIPDDIDALILIHPKDLSDKTLFAIDQFVLGGGRLLAFVDPLCLTEQETNPSASPYGGMAVSSDLNKLTKKWGVELVPSQVVADLDAASEVSFGRQGSERLPTWLTLREKHIDREEIATSSLENLMMPFPGALRIEEGNGITVARLVSASDAAALVSSFQAMQAGAEKMRAARPEEKASLAVRLQGRFKTAFPDGPPADAAEEGEKVEGGREDVSYLKEGEEDGVVVLVSDVDMLFDRFCLREMGFFGQRFYQPINDNLNFALNMVEQLAGSAALIGLRSRGTVDRPFDKVTDLEQKAQQRWQQEELKLVSKLQAAQARLSELQQAKDEDQQFILSPEQKQEIDKFRKERFETQRQLKQVRKNLRSDIERLGLTVKAVNMALMPAVVATFGLVHGWRRKKKASR